MARVPKSIYRRLPASAKRAIRRVVKRKTRSRRRRW